MNDHIIPLGFIQQKVSDYQKFLLVEFYIVWYGFLASFQVLSFSEYFVVVIIVATTFIHLGHNFICKICNQ